MHFIPLKSLFVGFLYIKALSYAIINIYLQHNSSVKGIWDMKKEDTVIIRLKAGSDEVRAFEDSYGEHCAFRSNYKNYIISDSEDARLLRYRLDKNHLYYMLAAVYNGDKITGAYWGCGQFIEKKGLCGFRLFARVKSGYNDRVKDIFKLAGTDISSDITVLNSKDIADRICSEIKAPDDGRVKEICIA